MFLEQEGQHTALEGGYFMLFYFFIFINLTFIIRLIVVLKFLGTLVSYTDVKSKRCDAYLLDVQCHHIISNF